ncbi:hypothetical protein T458_21290 [Brevibacillus panacihumi W25]|uniref:Cucumopine synthase C-terminal helical bundle domain-containing protein n=1 Tax=Brevibacillus panacihumi W25 TaxID=1408254 RepID=V6MEU9_9BACL|nr:hypothetical protein [Brevibacillus panacihumi]EST53923.1 hypothetical protein T458_21290 [Brevibacillus panacihumi W25]
MNRKIEDFLTELEKEIEEIWVNEPEDIYALKKGYLPSGAGIYGQYYSVLVMLGGEMRALGIHIFADLIAFSQDPEFDLKHLQTMAKRMLKIDVGVISYFGLARYGRYLSRYHELIEDMESKEEFARVTKSMFTYTNRYQMWLHQIFPWGVSQFFKQQTPETYREISENLERNHTKGRII